MMFKYVIQESYFREKKNEDSSDTVQQVFFSDSDLLKLSLHKIVLQAEPTSSCQQHPDLTCAEVILLTTLCCTP